MKLSVLREIFLEKILITDLVPIIGIGLLRFLLLVSGLINYIFQAVCPFQLNSLSCWHQLVLRYSYDLFNV